MKIWSCLFVQKLHLRQWACTPVLISQIQVEYTQQIFLAGSFESFGLFQLLFSFSRKKRSLIEQNFLYFVVKTEIGFFLLFGAPKLSLQF